MQSLSIETGNKNGVILSGRDAGLQLVVTGKFEAGQERDLTDQAQYEVSPKDIVAVDKTGYVTALREGKATIRATIADRVAQIDITVTNVITDAPINFKNDVVPIFTRFGCNAGGCHGKSGGQNGFALSLLGFEPEEDYEALVKEARGRRVLVTAPESEPERGAVPAPAQGQGSRRR